MEISSQFYYKQLSVQYHISIIKTLSRTVPATELHNITFLCPALLFIAEYIPNLNYSNICESF